MPWLGNDVIRALLVSSLFVLGLCLIESYTSVLVQLGRSDMSDTASSCHSSHTAAFCRRDAVFFRRVYLCLKNKCCFVKRNQTFRDSSCPSCPELSWPQPLWTMQRSAGGCLIQFYRWELKQKGKSPFPLLLLNEDWTCPEKSPENTQWSINALNEELQLDCFHIEKVFITLQFVAAHFHIGEGFFSFPSEETYDINHVPDTVTFDGTPMCRPNKSKALIPPKSH